MNRLAFYFLSGLLCTGSPMFGQAVFQPPHTPERPVTFDYFGQKFTDSYQWLEDGKNQEVLDWTLAQHTSTLDYINANYPAVEGLRDEIAAYIDRDYTGPDFLIGARQFFSRRLRGELQTKLFTRLDGQEILLFDPMVIDPDGKSAMSGNSYTEDASVAAIGLQKAGAEILTYYIIDTRTGKLLYDPIEGVYGFSFAKDGKHAYLTIRTREMVEKQEPPRTYWYTLGTSVETARFLFAPPDAKNISGIWDTRYSDITFKVDGDFLSRTLSMRKVGTFTDMKVIYSSDKYTADPTAIDDKIYFLTNHEAPHKKIMIADKENPEFENWKTLVPEQETVIENFVLTPAGLIVQDKKDLVSRLALYTSEGKFVRFIDLPALANVSYVSYHRESNTVYLGMESFTFPYRIYKCNPGDFAWELFYEMKTPLNTENITGSIVFYPSKDGTKVPLLLMHRKDVVLDGTNPTLLSGYGGFGIGESPSFVGLAALWINRGGVYARAGLRGGDEYGENWHKDGMQHKKQNTFDDFIAASEYLISQKYTSPNRLVIRGGSNGGLLMGAILTQRPDLYKACICAVPLLDMIRFHKFLIARYWIPEYGDPDNEDDFRYLFGYSPYHNIRKGVNVPTTLITAGANDVRVDPCHARKFAAALQNNTGQVDPVMLYIDYNSGHGSGKSVKHQIDDQEFQWRFLMQQAGIR